ncbi:MAG: hypothetical protein RR504_05400 [Christensenellaceae bacterium]
MSAESYGRVLLLMAICNISSIVFGTALNNARLVVNIDYQKKGLRGDFNPIFSVACVCNVAVVCVTLLLMNDRFSWAETIALSALSVLEMVRNYYAVKYMLEINFKKVLLQNVCYAVGGIIGLLLLSVFSLSWITPFMTASLFACVYTMFTVNIKEEKFAITPMFKNTMRVYGLLMITLLLSNVTSYLDRMVLYPFMGGEDVAIYTTAVFFGKSIFVLMAPIANVLLSYYARREKIAVKMFLKQTLIFVIVGVVFYVLTLTGVAKWVTGILYPTLVEGALPYIAIGNMAAIILVVASMLQPAVLKFCSTRWQPIIQGIHIALSFGLGLLLLIPYGLIGFCAAAVIANVVKLIMLFVVGLFTLKKKESTAVLE